MSDFKIGDTVRLKSGGPLMTVAAITQVSEQEISGGVSVRCQWMGNANKQESGSFHPDTLMEADNKPAKIRAVNRMV